jgi:hypothetical protein
MMKYTRLCLYVYFYERYNLIYVCVYKSAVVDCFITLIIQIDL